MHVYIIVLHDISRSTSHFFYLQRDQSPESVPRYRRAPNPFSATTKFHERAVVQGSHRETPPPEIRFDKLNTLVPLLFAY